MDELEQKQSKRKQSIVQNYHTEQLPHIKISYTDSGGGFEIESSDHDYQTAFNGAIFLLDKRMKHRSKSYKDRSIG